MSTTERPLERDCETTIIAAATILGYRVHAERPAQSRKGWRTPVRGHPGYPDLTIIGHGSVFLAELKRRPNRPTADQLAWIDAARAAGAWAGIVYVPEEQDAFIDRLTAAATRRRTL